MSHKTRISGGTRIYWVKSPNSVWPRPENYMNMMLPIMVRSFLFKTSDIANGAFAVHFVMNAFYNNTVTNLAASSRLFLYANEALPANGDCAMGELIHNSL